MSQSESLTEPDSRTDRPAARRGKDKDLEQALYEKRQKIYPRQVHGLFARLRLSGVAAPATPLALRGARSS